MIPAGEKLSTGRKILSHCHFYWPGNEPGPLRWKLRLTTRSAGLTLCDCYVSVGLCELFPPWYFSVSISSGASKKCLFIFRHNTNIDILLWCLLNVSTVYFSHYQAGILIHKKNKNGQRPVLTNSGWKFIYNLTNDCTIISNSVITNNMLLHVSTFKMSSSGNSLCLTKITYRFSALSKIKLLKYKMLIVRRTINILLKFVILYFNNFILLRPENLSVI